MATNGNSLTSFRPFQNESDSVAIDKLTIENRVDRLECFGSLTITRDKAGLASARALKQLLDAAILALSTEQLPEHIEEKAPTIRKNPFA